MSSWWYIDYDDSEDRKRLYDKTLDLLDKKAGSDTWYWVELWVILQYIFSKPQPSIQQLKKEIKEVLLSKRQ